MKRVLKFSCKLFLFLKYFFLLNLKKLMYLCVYIFTCQLGLTFFEGFVEYPWGNNRLKSVNFFLSKIPRATPALQLVLYDKLAHMYYVYIF